MAPFRFRSVRAKLIATTMTVFASLLTVLVLVADFASRRAVFKSIDDDLQRRGEDFAQLVAHDRRGGRRGMREGLDGPRRGLDPTSGPVSFPRDGPGPGPGPAPDGMPHGSGRNGRPDPQWLAPNSIPLRNDHIPGYDPLKVAYDPIGFGIAAKGQTVTRTLSVDGDLRRILSVPSRNQGHIAGVVQIAYEMQPALDALDNFRATLMKIVVPLGLLFGGAASFFVVDRLLKPLRYVNSEADRIGREGFGERLVPLGDDEFASLSVTLNGMLGRLESLYRVEQETNLRLAQTIAQQQRFTSDASHELKTPLSIVKAYIGLMKQSKGTVADESDSIAAIDLAADRMNVLIRDLLVLARGDAGNNAPRQPCDLRRIVDDAILCVPAARDRVRVKGVTATVSASADELLRVFVNLIDNALRHSGAESVEVDLRVIDGRAAVTVSDGGLGIAPEHLPHVFERFYRPDESRSADTGGSGLGLAICEQIVEAHGGMISVESALGAGSRFTVALPMTPEPGQ